jgi:hypothetical protein
LCMHRRVLHESSGVWLQRRVDAMPQVAGRVGAKGGTAGTGCHVVICPVLSACREWIRFATICPT